MKRFTLLLSLGLGVLLLAGCNDVKRKATEVGRGAWEHGLSKSAANAQDKADEAINKASEPGTDKQSKDRNALKGGDDESDK